MFCRDHLQESENSPGREKQELGDSLVSQRLGPGRPFSTSSGFVLSSRAESAIFFLVPSGFISNTNGNLKTLFLMERKQGAEGWGKPACPFLVC